MPNPLGRALRNRRAGHDTLVWARSDLQAPESFTLTSPAFDHGDPDVPFGKPATQALTRHRPGAARHP